MKRVFTKQHNFSWRARGRSFKYAFYGISNLLREHNAWLHCGATLCAVATGFIFHISSAEWLAIILCIGGVFSLEAVNTAIEALCDNVSVEFSPLIKKAKDTAAAAVLIMAVISVIVAGVIFIPKIF